MKNIIFGLSILIGLTCNAQMTVNQDGLYSFSNTSIPSGNTVTAATSKTYFTSNAIIIPDMWVTNRTIIIKADGFYTISGLVLTLSGSLDFINTSTSAVSVITTGTIPSSLGVGTNQYWEGEIRLNVMSISAGVATYNVAGKLTFYNTLGGATTMPLAGTSTATINTNNTYTINLGTNWAATTGNSIQLRDLIIYKQ